MAGFFQQPGQVVGQKNPPPQTGDWFDQNQPQVTTGDSSLNTNPSIVGLNPSNSQQIQSGQPGGTAPQITNPNDPAQVQAFFAWLGTQPNTDPILRTPQGQQYYTTQAINSGGLTDTNYWSNKGTLASAGGAVGAGTGISGSQGSHGSLAEGYGKQYQLPSASDLQNMPGYQAAIDAATQGTQRSAAANGTLLTGGLQSRLQKNLVNVASQQYGNLANLGLGAFQTNYGVWNNDQNNLFNRNFSISQLGQNASAQS